MHRAAGTVKLGQFCRNVQCGFELLQHILAAAVISNDVNEVFQCAYNTKTLKVLFTSNPLYYIHMHLQ